MTLAGSLACYDLVDLLEIVGGLQLVPQNASRATRLEALAHTVASLPIKPGPRISAGKLRQICEGPELSALAYAEDPSDNVFAEEFPFFGGSYIVMTGIAEGGEFILSNLCKALFLKQDQRLPRQFLMRAFQLVFAGLHASHEVSRRAGIRRGMAPVSDRYRPIFLPTPDRLSQLKDSVSISKERLRAILSSAKLPTSALDPIIMQGMVKLDEYDLVNGPLLWQPFVDCGDRIVLVIPGMIVSAVRQALVRAAITNNLQAEFARAYNAAVWDSVVECLGYTGNEPYPRPTPQPLTIPCASDGFFTLDHDKVLYCLLVTDPLTGPADTDPFRSWTDDDLQRKVYERVLEVEKFVLTASPSPNELFVIVALEGLGGAGGLGLPDTPAGSHCLLTPVADLRTITLLEGGDPLILFNFARAQLKVRQTTEITTTSILDEFYLFRKNGYTYYVSDEARYDLIAIPPGDALNLRLEVSQERDFHAAESPEGGVVEVTALHGTSKIPVYVPVADLGKKVAVLVEGLPLPIWVTAGDASHDPEMHRQYALFADALAFWLWQFTPTLAPLLSFLKKQGLIEIRLCISPDKAWKNSANAAVTSSDPPLAVHTLPDISCIEVTINAGMIPLLRTGDNSGERELLRHLLRGFQPLLPEATRDKLSPVQIEKSLDRYAPLGLKKMLLLLDTNRNPQLDPRGLPKYRPLQKVRINDQLDSVGEYLKEKANLQVGKIDRDDWVPILNDIALCCFRQVERLVGTLSPTDLLEFIVAHSEAVSRQTALDWLTVPTQLQCFKSIPEMIEQLSKKIPERSHVALASRFLIEFVVAQPPKGYRPISLDLYDELRAWAYHLINYAMLSDAVHFRLQEYELSFLASHRLGVNGDAWRSAIEGHTRAFALDQIGTATQNYARQWSAPIASSEQQVLQKEIDVATRFEFGVPLSELLSLMTTAIEIGHDLDPGVTTANEDDFIARAARSLRWANEDVKRSLSLLTLSPRSSFWTPPNGYSKQELYPWRFDRKVSYLRRPFLTRPGAVCTEIVWANRHMHEAQLFLINQCMSGRLRANSPEMRSFNSRICHTQGEAFNDEVFEFFARIPRVSAKSRVKRIGSSRELEDHLGDIDVLAADADRRRILVIECKDFATARTPYEMANEMTDLFTGKKGKKSTVEKQRARARWVRENLDEVLSFLKVSGKKKWNVLPLIVADQPLVATYLRSSPILVVSLEELKQFWPTIRHV